MKAMVPRKYPPLQTAGLVLFGTADQRLVRAATLCVGCPFRSAGGWVAVSKTDPDLFADACELDEKLRAMMLTSPERRVYGPVYLHRRRKPLAQAVALDTVEIESQGRLDLGDG